MEAPWESGFKALTSLISEFVVDDEKMAQIQLEIGKVKASVKSDLLKTSTTPKVDAFVKILIAFNDLILPWFRPIGAGMMTAVGLWFHYKQIPIDGAVHAMIDGAFPAWGTSRHINKQSETKAKAQVRAKTRDDYSDWDDEP